MSRSATGIAANYRAVTRARSRREFVAKLAVAVEEADETLGWLEILIQSQTVSAEECEALTKESRELVAILAASRKTAERRLTRPRDPPPPQDSR